MNRSNGRYYGWNIVAASTLITLLTVGMRMGIGPFFIPLVNDLGISRTTLGSIVAAGMLAYGVGMPLAGHLAQTRGSRFTLLLGGSIVTVSIIWTILTSTVFGFFMSFGLLLSLGFAFTSPVALTPVISRWFIRQRGKALFYLSTGSMAGIAVLTPLLTFAIEQLGWRGTLLAFNGIFLLLLIPMALFIMREQPPVGADAAPDQQGAAATPSAAPLAELRSAEALRTSYFWKIAAGLFACGFSMNLLGTQGVPMLIDHGFSPMVASYGIGLVGLVAIAGTVILGQLADRVPRRLLLTLVYSIRAIGFIGLLLAAQRWQLYGVAIIAGVVWAGNMALSSAILADIYGIRMVGVLYGWSYLGHQVGATISSWLGGWGYEQFGTHWISFGSAALVLILAGIISIRLPASQQDVPAVHPQQARMA